MAFQFGNQLFDQRGFAGFRLAHNGDDRRQDNLPFPSDSVKYQHPGRVPGKIKPGDSQCQDN
jgi:hypothetical protein